MTAVTTPLTHRGGCLFCRWVSLPAVRCDHPSGQPLRPAVEVARESGQSCGADARLWEYRYA